MKVRIGIADAAMLELEVDDADAVVSDYETARSNGTSLLWVTEKDGKRHGIAVERIVYLGLDPETSKKVGFA